MAQGITGYKEYSGANGYNYRVNYSETYDVTTNKSTFTITSVQLMGTWYYGGTFYLDGSVTVDGSTAVSVSSSAGGSSTSINALNTWYTFSNSSGSVSVTHANDGSKSVTVALNLAAYTTSGSWSGRAQDSFTVTLTTIPRASSATWSGTTLGGNMVVNINRAVSSFTHTVKLVFGSKSVQKTGVGTSVTLAMGMDWCNVIPNSASGTGTLTITTYNGSTKIGERSYTMSLSVPASVIPTVSATATGVSLYEGLYMQGRSSVNIKATAGGVYGSTIRSYSIVGAGYSSSNSEATLGPLNVTGDVEFVVTVVDSRGKSNTAKVKVTVIAYTKPTLTVNACYRAKADGTADQGGTYIYAKATFGFAPLNGKNAISGSVSYKEDGAAAYTGETALISGTGKTVFGGKIALNKNYLVKFTAVDSVGEKVEAVQVIASSANYLITAKLGKIAIGGYVDDSLSDGLQVTGDIHGSGTLNLNGKSFLDKVYPVGAIYISTNATSPATLFGGTWEAIAMGRTLVGAGTSDANSTNYFGDNTTGVTFNAGGTGGQMYHTLTVNEMPKHSHRILQANNSGTSGTWVTNASTSNSLKVAYSGSSTSNSVIETTGGGGRHNNMPPYLTVYMWKRTA